MRGQPRGLTLLGRVVCSDATAELSVRRRIVAPLQMAIYCRLGGERSSSVWWAVVAGGGGLPDLSAQLGGRRRGRVGDLPGICAQLDHLAGARESLGVDAIWLSPFYASPMVDFGYDVSDHCAVDPTFGTLADFDGC